MAIDSKYGHVTLEHGSIGEDEPVVVFRASDRLLPRVIQFYKFLCWCYASPRRHRNMLERSRQGILQWQQAHSDQVRVPTSEHSRAWLPWMGD